jgi:hypothetical protein
MPGWRDRWGFGEPPSPWRVTLLVTPALALVLLVNVRIDYPGWNLVSRGSVILVVAGTVSYGLLLMLTQTLANRGYDERRRRAMARYGIDRLDDWLALGRALREGEPPVDTRLDGPLLALVRRGRDQIARLRPVALLTLLVVIMMVALNPDGAAIFRTAFFGVLVASWTATVERRSRRLARLEGRLRCYEREARRSSGGLRRAKPS